MVVIIDKNTGEEMEETDIFNILLEDFSIAKENGEVPEDMEFEEYYHENKDDYEILDDEDAEWRKQKKEYKENLENGKIVAIDYDFPDNVSEWKENNETFLEESGYDEMTEEEQETFIEKEMREEWNRLSSGEKESRIGTGDDFPDIIGIETWFEMVNTTSYERVVKWDGKTKLSDDDIQELSRWLDSCSSIEWRG
jgi:hypothetical protein